MSNNKELSQDYFDRHPGSDQCHITTDGRVFHTIGAASSYAAALENTNVETFKREVTKAEDIEVNDAEFKEAPQDETPEDETPQDETPEDETPEDENQVIELPISVDENGSVTLANFDEKTTSYEDAKALFAELGLKAKSNKKVDIFAALTAAKKAAQTQE